MKVWKVLGVAGLAGVAATGAIVARNERRRAQLTPEEIRERLHQRHAAAVEPAPPEPEGGVAETSAGRGWRSALDRLRRRPHRSRHGADPSSGDRRMGAPSAFSPQRRL